MVPGGITYLPTYLPMVYLPMGIAVEIGVCMRRYEEDILLYMRASMRRLGSDVSNVSTRVLLLPTLALALS